MNLYYTSYHSVEEIVGFRLSLLILMLGSFTGAIGQITRWCTFCFVHLYYWTYEPLHLYMVVTLKSKLQKRVHCDRNACFLCSIPDNC